MNAQVSMPVFYQEQGAHQKSIAQLQQSRGEQGAISSMVMNEVSQAFFQLNLNAEQYQRYRTDLLPRTQQLAQKAKLSFEAGKSPVFVALQAQQAYVEAQLSALAVWAGYYNAWSDLERASGGAF
jgi:outer membrane protein TolC